MERKISPDVNEKRKRYSPNKLTVISFICVVFTFCVSLIYILAGLGTEMVYLMLLIGPIFYLAGAVLTIVAFFRFHSIKSMSGRIISGISLLIYLSFLNGALYVYF